MASIGVNLYTIHSKNINNVQKDVNDLLSVIIILGTDAHGGETVFKNGMTMNDIWKTEHVLNHSNGRCVVGASDKNLYEGYISNGTRAVLFFYANQYFITLYIMVQNNLTSI